MGSFNTSCFASQQTIAPRDPCWVLPIVQSASYMPVELHLPSGVVSVHGIADTTCYPNSFWNPAGPFLEAVYADYGRVELTDTPANRYKLLQLVSQWRRTIAKVVQGENEYHDVPLDVAEFIATKTPKLNELFTVKEVELTNADRSLLWEECNEVLEHVWEGHREHRLFAMLHGGEPRAMQFAVLHADAAQALVEQVSALTNWEKQSLHPKELFRRALAEGRKVALEQAEKADDKEVAAQVLPYFIGMRAREVFETVGNCTGVSYMLDNRALEHIIAMVVKEALTEEAGCEKAMPYLQSRYIIEGLTTHNLHISPMVYAGQDYDNEIGRGYAKFIREVSAKVSKRRRSED